jgi:hypothetical protein
MRALLARGERKHYVVKRVRASAGSISSLLELVLEH